MWGTGGEGTLLGGGWGRGYCSELPVPRGPVCQGVGTENGTGVTRLHKHTGHSTGVGREAGRRIALQESGQVGTPPSNWNLGRKLEAITFPPCSGWGDESPSLGLGKKMGSHVPGPGRGRELVPHLGWDTEGRPVKAVWAAAPVPTSAESITPHRLSCQPPLCWPWPSGPRGDPHHPHCRSCSR